MALLFRYEARCVAGASAFLELSGLSPLVLMGIPFGAEIFCGADSTFGIVAGSFSARPVGCGMFSSVYAGGLPEVLGY